MLFRQVIHEVFALEREELAVLGVLMLRGPQTVGEIKERTGRLYDFRDLNDVNETLENLLKREEPLITRLERAPGQKEARYAHLLSGEVTSYTPPERTSRGGAGSDERAEKLEQELENLKSELSAFRQEFEDFKRQFE